MADIESFLERYDAAWNDQDVDSIVAMHAPGMVFENHTAGTRAEGDGVRGHIAQIFENWPDMRFQGRKLQVREGLAVSEWTASATKKSGEKIEWDGVDIFEFEEGLIKRKGVYSSSATPRSLGE
jgi:beta-alanine degradation protein BauB